MSIGMRGYNQLRNLEQELEKVGLYLAWPKFGDGDKHFGLCVAEGRLPVWQKDQQIFYGTLEEIEAWFSGWQKCGEYLRSLKVVDRKRVEHAETLLLQQRFLQDLERDHNDDESE